MEPKRVGAKTYLRENFVVKTSRCQDISAPNRRRKNFDAKTVQSHTNGLLMRRIMLFRP